MAEDQDEARGGGHRAGGHAARSGHAAAGTQSLGRGLGLLRLVAAAGPAGLRVTDVAARAGLHLATAHRQMAALLREGFVAQDPATRHYTAGPELLSLAFAAGHRFGLESRILPMLDRLAAATGDVVYATARSGAEAVCLARREGSYPIRALPVTPGMRRPLGVGAGSLSILANLPEAEAEAILQQNAAGYAAIGQSVESIRGFMRRAQREGHALNDAEIIPGMVAMALPVFAEAGRPALGISIVAIEARMTSERRAEILALLRRETAAVAHPAPAWSPAG
jgi:DNA-binding IclR family transcriptional regulator